MHSQAYLDSSNCNINPSSPPSFYASMRVPYDVLLAILDIQSSRADVQTISSMSQTCQVLRSAGVRHLLAHPIDLRDSRGVTSFNSFMHAERGRRFPLLRRRLAITTGSLPPDAAEALVELVCKISHLERLVLLDAEHLLASDPRLPRAFAALTCLKHIEFSAAQESDNSDCVYMFKRMRSQLASATLHLPSSTRRWLNGRLNCELADPVGLLRNSASTLTELRGTSFEARRHNVIYPHVKRLQVQFGLLPDISPYIIAYPNITSLDVTSSSTFDVTTLPSFCWMNEDAQQRVGCWSTLEELGGDLADLYVISLRCRAESLRVSARGRRGVLHYLTEVLSRAQPARLRLEIDSSALLASEDSSLAAVFQRTEASKCIRELDLRIVQTQGDGRADVDVLFGYAVRIIKPLQLTSFKFQIDSEGKDAVARTSLTWDAVLHLERVRRACPTLKELVVGCSGAPDQLYALSVHRSA